VTYEDAMKKLAAADPETLSADVLAGNLEQLKSLFPEVATEGGIDFEVLKQLLGGAVDEREEKYGLTWHGKRRARQAALAPSAGTLRPCPGDSVDWDTTRNLMIEGDNLEVLKLLQKSYSGKVKLIYIDPPYNTGNDFVYPDRYDDNLATYLRYTGQVSDDGFKTSSNTEASGRFHTNWLNMMYPRLKLARSLLRDDGVILVSIDDAELAHLRLLLDSVLGAENFVGSFVWQGGRKNDARLISISHDYIVVYARSLGSLRGKDVRWRERKDGLRPVYEKVTELRGRHGSDYGTIHAELMKWYRTLPDGHPSKAHDHFNYVDKRGVYYPDNLRSPNPRPNLVFDWKGYKPHPNGWAYGPDKMAEFDTEERLHYPDARDQRIKIKSYLHEHEEWPPGSVFYKDRRSSSKALAALMGADVFDFPKDVDVLSRLVSAICGPGDVVLDFFAGSGATGHAVMASDVSSPSDARRFVLVQLPEPLSPDDKHQQAAAAFCDSIARPRNIAELTKERLRRASKQLRQEDPLSTADLGFRVFKLDSSNIRSWEADRQNLSKSLLESIEHLKGDRTETDIVYELLLKLGLDLCVPIEKKRISGKEVHSIGGGVLLACLAAKITREQVEQLAEGIVEWHKALGPAGDTTCVFRDSAFADDVAKTNLAAILSQHGIANVRSL